MVLGRLKGDWYSMHPYKPFGQTSIYLAFHLDPLAGRKQNLDNSTANRAGSQRLGAATDVTGVFCTSGSEREFTLEGSWYADQEIQAGADRDAAAAG